MLKLTYTEAGLHLEQIAVSLEEVVAQRVLIAIRAGHQICVEPGRAAFLLPADALDLPHLELMLRQEQGQTATITAVDSECVEISFEGTWIASSASAEEGMFLTAFSEWAEVLVFRLWEMMRSQVSFPRL